MPGAFDRRATQRGGMPQRPNVAVVVKRSTYCRQTQRDRRPTESVGDVYQDGGDMRAFHVVCPGSLQSY